MLTKSCYTSQRSRQNVAGGHRLPRPHAGTHMFTCMRSHVHQAVPVTSFLGDSAQPESHTSESPREQAAAGKERIRGGETTVRQAGGPPASGCRRRIGPAAEDGGGEGSDFLALGRLLGVGRSDYRGAGTLPARTGIMRCLQNAGILWSTENPPQSRPGIGPVGYHCPGEGSLDLPLWPRGWLAPQGLVAPGILARPAGSAGWAWSFSHQGWRAQGQPPASGHCCTTWASMSCPALAQALVA